MHARPRISQANGLPAFERLEARLLLSGSPVISEFMAVNDDTLADEDGDHPDWIEIHNPSAEAVDLTGWRLRDGEFEWTFPAVTLAPGEYLVVFASDKNRRVAGAELHTNFRLDGGGEYLALLDDAGSVVHEYAPAYPPQLEDISYGLMTDVQGQTPLIRTSDAAAYLVPSDGGLGLSWTEPAFDDAAWSTGATGLGFGLPEPDAALTLVEAGAQWRYLDDGSDQGTAWREPAFDDGAWSVGPAQLGYGDGDEATVASYGGESADKHITTYFRHTFSVSHAWRIDALELELLRDDGAVVYLNGREILRSNMPGGEITCETRAAEGVGGADESTFFHFSIDPAGMLEDGANVLAVEIHQRSPTSSDISFDLELTAAASAPDLLATDIEAEMLGVNASLYVRVPFTVGDPAELTGLVLAVAYEDGCAAYLNGAEVARRNAPAAAEWDSSAPGDRALQDALELETIDLAGRLDLLRAGENVLAIHALNDSVTDGEFLIAAELTGLTHLGDQEQYFTTPTPGGENVPGALGVAAEPTFSIPRGFYDGEVCVEIATATEGAEVRYTLDGSAPTAATGTPYGGPISVAATGVLRAAAFKPGFQPSSVATHTYLIDESEAIKSLPVISLVGDEEETFGTASGLWADVLLRGRAAEFPVSFEVIQPKDNSGIQQDGGIRLHGSSYRRRTIGANPDAKWSFKVFFRNEYDEKGWLSYPLIEAGEVDRYKNLTLRGGYNDPTNPFIKDELGRRLFADMGGVASLGTFANLFINGRLKNNGYYNPVERYDERMFQEKLHSDYAWDVVEKWQPSGTPADGPRNHDAPYYFDVRDGDEVHFAELLDYALANDLSQDAHYQEVARRLDIPQFIDYLILQGYTRIHDWPQNNWTAARERSGGPLGKWRFYAWDLEFGWGSGDLAADFKTPGGGDLMPLDILYSSLVVNDEFRQLFADRAQRAFFNGGALAAENVVMRFEDLRDEMAGVLSGMNTYIRDTWAAGRPGYVLDSMAAKGLFTFEGPRFHVNGSDRHGGRIVGGDVLTITAPAGTIYYTLDGSDPRLPGGAVSAGAVEYAGAVTLDHSYVVRARVLDGGAWSGLTEAGFHVDISGALRISEIMYHPAEATPEEIAAGFADREAFEYVELTNIAAETIQLGKVRFTDGIYATLSGADLASGEYAVVAADAAAFEARYGGGVRVLGEYAGSLANGGEAVTLQEPLGGVIHRFEYGDWYDVADGEGYSLTAVDPAGEAALWNRPDGWKPSEVRGGTPGAGDDGLAPGAIVITEVLAHSHAGADDWIELLNTTGEDVDLGGWFLSDSGLDLGTCEVPAGTVVPAGAYLVLAESDHFGAAFALSELGDDVYLSSGQAGELGGYREHVDFGASPRGKSFGLHVKSTGATDFALLTDPTPGAENAGPFVGPLVINELMYHPPPPEPGGGHGQEDFEFVELYNASGEEVDLTQYVLSGGVGFTFGWVDADDAGTAKWTLQAGATATWQAELPEDGEYEALAWWDAADGEGGLRVLDSAAEYRVQHAGGSTTAVIEQSDYSRQWVSLGTYAFRAGPAAVTLTRGGDDPDEWTLADRVKFVAGENEIVIDDADAVFHTPGSDVTSLAPGGYVVIARNVEAFDERYDIAGSGITVAGQYTGRLANDGERVEVLRACTAEPSGYIPYVRGDYVNYGDAIPWPAECDGLGASLCRLRADAYGNDAGNWAAGAAGGTPGAENQPIDTTPPSVPGALVSAVAPGAGRIDLTWLPAGDSQSRVDHYVIYRNDAPYDTSAESRYSDANVLPATPYSYRVSAVNRDGYEGGRSEPAEVTIAGITSVTASDETTIRLVFSEAVEEASAELAANYDVSGATVTAAALEDAATVVLTSSGLEGGQTYVVTVNGVATVSGGPMPADLQVSFVFSPLGSGRILLEYWTGIGGNSVSDLTGQPDYPDSPDGRDYPAIFELPAGELDLGDNYGTRMRGYLHPPVTGNYVFWIASDNAGQLLLSTDESPENAVQIASVSGWTRSREWDKYGTQQSVEVPLQAGVRYYVEALQKEGGGGDNLAVGWRLPDATMERPIPDVRLSPYALGPSVEGFVHNDGARAPGELRSVSARFSEDVSASLESGDLVVHNRSTGAYLDAGAATLEYTAGTNVARWDLSELAAEPGYYTLTLAAEEITNAAGFALDGDGDGIPGGDCRLAIMVALPGDAGRDGKVDFLDYLALKKSLGTSSGASWADGDFDGDGDVDRDDFARLRTGFGKSLAVAPPEKTEGESPAQFDAAGEPMGDGLPAVPGRFAPTSSSLIRRRSGTSEPREERVLPPVEYGAAPAAAAAPDVLAEAAAAASAAEAVPGEVSDETPPPAALDADVLDVFRLIPSLPGLPQPPQAAPAARRTMVS